MVASYSLLLLAYPSLLVSFVVQRRRVTSSQEIDETTSEGDVPDAAPSRTFWPCGFILAAIFCISIIDLHHAQQFKSFTKVLNGDYSKSKTTQLAKNDCIDVVASYSPSNLVGIYGDLSAQYYRGISPNHSISSSLFDQGMLHTFGFNTVEGIRNFKAGLEDDPSCIMCYWGIAYANGPNINTDVSRDMAQCSRDAILKASAILSSTAESSIISAANRALISAQLSMNSFKSLAEWEGRSQKHYDLIFRDAMRENFENFPDDTDIAAIYAESILNLTPWDYYKSESVPPANNIIVETVKVLKEDVELAMKVLRSVLDKSPLHPLALHLWIHVTEASSNPQQGEREADALASLATHGSGTSHLLHMPAHIYLRVGRYFDAVTSSILAITSDNLYLKKCLTPYVPSHNIAMLVSASLLCGSFDQALAYSPYTSYSMPDAVASYLPALFATPKDIILARMGEWRRLIELSPVEQHNVVSNHGTTISMYNSSRHSLIRNKDSTSSLGLKLFLRMGRSGVLTTAERSLATSSPPYVRAMSAYSRTLAHTGLGDLSAATDSLNVLSAAVSGIPPDPLPSHHPFYSNHQEIGRIFLLIAKAALALKNTNADRHVGVDEAIALLREAVTIQSAFSYMEPEHFYFPVRQCLGAAIVRKVELSMDSDDNNALSALIDDAVKVYERDVREHPNNIWSLKGLEIAFKLSARVCLNKKSSTGADSYTQQNDAVKDSVRKNNEALEKAMLHTPSQYQNFRGSCCELSLC